MDIRNLIKKYIKINSSQCSVDKWHVCDNVLYKVRTMKTNAYISPNLLQRIRNAISNNWVSSYIDPTGQMREYSVAMPDGRYLTLTSDVIDNEYEYMIYIDDEEICYFTISVANKVLSPHMEQVLNLFNQCSAKVIWQEINRALKLPALGQKYKSYS